MFQRRKIYSPLRVAVTKSSAILKAAKGSIVSTPTDYRMTLLSPPTPSSTLSFRLPVALEMRTCNAFEEKLGNCGRGGLLCSFGMFSSNAFRDLKNPPDHSNQSRTSGSSTTHRTLAPMTYRKVSPPSARPIKRSMTRISSSSPTQMNGTDTVHEVVLPMSNGKSNVNVLSLLYYNRLQCHGFQEKRVFQPHPPFKRNRGLGERSPSTYFINKQFALRQSCLDVVPRKRKSAFPFTVGESKSSP
ncbi:unnamed protein product [Larinioides sclopetarius]|uniref:Uncharacterized protein n=1 Tax=Larinioides sclopetarius TaxID=280406 RepID=A0AAV1Z590_9ARAC